MAKLYWRVKRDGKWTWRPAKINAKTNRMSYVFNWKEEEE